MQSVKSTEQGQKKGEMRMYENRTVEEVCRELFRKVTDFYLEHLPDDMVPYWDLSFWQGSSEPRDSSAAAAAAERMGCP